MQRPAVFPMVGLILLLSNLLGSLGKVEVTLDAGRAVVREETYPYIKGKVGSHTCLRFLRHGIYFTVTVVEHPTPGSKVPVCRWDGKE